MALPFGDLTLDEMNAIKLELLIGKPNNITGPDADKYRAHMRTFIAKVEAEGGHVAIPAELEDLDDEEKDEPPAGNSATLNFNPNHDELGRFAESDSAGGGDKFAESPGEALVPDTGFHKAAGKLKDGDYNLATDPSKPWLVNADLSYTTRLRKSLGHLSNFRDTKFQGNCSIGQGVDVEVSKGLKRAALFVPQLKVESVKFDGTYPDPDTYAEVLPLEDGKSQLVVNGSQVQSLDKLHGMLDEDFKKGFHTVNGLDGVIVHEMGHAFMNQFPNLSAERYVYDKDIPPASELSKYGITSPHECFAEAFAACAMKPRTMLTDYEEGFMQALDKDRKFIRDNPDYKFSKNNFPEWVWPHGAPDEGVPIQPGKEKNKRMDIGPAGKAFGLGFDDGIEGKPSADAKIKPDYRDSYQRGYRMGRQKHSGASVGKPMGRKTV